METPSGLMKTSCLTSKKRFKLKWYGHVTRSSELAKTILQGTVQGGRRRGRQRKRWEDNIKEWTGFEWNMILRKAENHEEWRKNLQWCSNGQPDCGIDKTRRRPQNACWDTYDCNIQIFNYRWFDTNSILQTSKHSTVICKRT